MLSASPRSTLMMPLAFDLISTFVIGSTLPVATTDRTIVPRSTVAIREGSTSADAPLSVASPYAPPSTTTATTPRTYGHFRDFLVLELIWSFYEVSLREVQVDVGLC